MNNLNTVYVIGTPSCSFCKLILWFLNNLNIKKRHFDIKFYDFFDKNNYDFALDKNINIPINFPAVYIYTGKNYIKLNNSELLKEMSLYYNLNNN